MVRALKENLKVPVCCKIRMLSNRQKTIELAKRYIEISFQVFRRLAAVCCVFMEGLRNRIRIKWVHVIGQ
jgi:hypothetical protein